MLVKSLLLLAAAAFAAVSAAPGVDSGLTERGEKPCNPGEKFVGFWKKCKCEAGKTYDPVRGTCSYPVHRPKTCGKGEKFYCAKSVDDWCEYDRRRDTCDDDGGSKSFCCRPENIKKKLYEVCPPHEVCSKPRYWDVFARTCECEKGKVWHDKKCVWKPNPKPKCGKGEAPYCAADYSRIVKYDEWHPWCGDNDRHITFCCDPTPGKPEKKCKTYWDNGRD